MTKWRLAAAGRVDNEQSDRGNVVSESPDTGTVRRMPTRARLGAAGVVVATLAGVLFTLGSPVDAAPIPEDRSHQFPDVNDANIFHDAIDFMVDHGFVTGYADGMYHPLDMVSRQAFVTVLWRMSGEPGGPFPPEPFTDIEPSNQFYTAISWAYSSGVIGGYADGTFRPTNAISRQAFGAMLHDLSGIGEYYSKMSYSDVPDSHVFAEDIWWWTASGQARGYPDGTFRPTDPVTRQGAASFFTNFYEMMGGAWPYLDHHEHVCDVEPTEEQNAAADALLAAAEAQVPVLFPTKGAALAAGYVVVAGPAGPRAGSHLVKPAYVVDGIDLDPTKPESLVVAPSWPAAETNSAPIAAEMFLRDYVGSGPTWPPEPGGCRTLWHAHDNLCHSTSGSGLGVTGIATAGGCPSGSMVRISPEMLHVWVDGRADPFEGIET